MSIARRTKPVSRQKNMCQRYMMFVHHICICLPKTIPDNKNIGIYAPLIGTLAGPFGEIELLICNVIILVYAILIQVYLISKCLNAK
jgi:hypothetical protein